MDVRTSAIEATEKTPLDTINTIRGLYKSITNVKDKGEMEDEYIK